MTDPAPAQSTSVPRRSRRGGMVTALLVLVLLALAGWRGWEHWQQLQVERAAAARDDDAHWRGLEQRVDALRQDQRAQAQRIAQSDATNRVLRDEILGIGQRAALLEDSVAELADPLRRGSGSLRLDEAELLLSLGERRLRFDGDLVAAKRAYAMAADVLEALDDPALLDLRQALQQERVELEALESDPAVDALRQLDGFEQALPALDDAPAVSADTDAPWWKRAFGRIVQVQPTDRSLTVAPGERRAGHAALLLELALARSAAARRDVDGWRAALRRADGWMQRLWPRSGQLEQRRATLRDLREHPLRPVLPALGSTAEQLRSTRNTR